MLACNCSLAGSNACLSCQRYIQQFGKQEVRPSQYIPINGDSFLLDKILKVLHEIKDKLDEKK